MTACEHGDDQLLDDIALTDDELAHLRDNFLITGDQQCGRSLIIKGHGGGGNVTRCGNFLSFLTWHVCSPLLADRPGSFMNLVPRMAHPGHPSMTTEEKLDCRACQSSL